MLTVGGFTLGGDRVEDYAFCKVAETDGVEL